MSYVASIQTRVRDPVAVAAACRRLDLPPPVYGIVHFCDGHAIGLIVHLPGCLAPAVIDLETGTLRYDHRDDLPDDRTHLHRFLRAYAVEKTRSIAVRKGLHLIDERIEDGSIRLQIQRLP